MHPLDAGQFQARYPRFVDAEAQCKRVHPDGQFLNEHLRSVFGGSRPDLTSGLTGWE